MKGLLGKKQFKVPLYVATTTVKHNKCHIISVMLTFCQDTTQMKIRCRSVLYNRLARHGEELPCHRFHQLLSQPLLPPRLGNGR